MVREMPVNDPLLQMTSPAPSFHLYHLAVFLVSFPRARFLRVAALRLTFTLPCRPKRMAIFASVRAFADNLKLNPRWAASGRHRLVFRVPITWRDSFDPFLRLKLPALCFEGGFFCRRRTPSGPFALLLIRSLTVVFNFARGRCVCRPPKYRTSRVLLYLLQCAFVFP